MAIFFFFFWCGRNHLIFSNLFNCRACGPVLSFPSCGGRLKRTISLRSSFKSACQKEQKKKTKNNNK